MKRTLLLYTSKLFMGIAAFMILTASGCSYVSDYIEAQLTDRASFSIDAEYIPGTGVVIRWNESGGTNFAGFEVYITERPDDEYAGYTIIAGPYSTLSDASNASYYESSSALLTSTTDSFTVDLTHITNIKAALNSGNGGNFFFRVGILDWDQNEDDREYTPSSTTYLDHTEFDQISGYAMVYIP
ncbi:MAG TPA: hypothetical protein PK544_01085 [Spirochaetota bacterium]|nr:hypothetical protein [Spirochaetota bacterium]